MRILVNALSVTNLSGRHVLLGHLGRLAEWTRGESTYHVLHASDYAESHPDLGPNVHWMRGPAFSRQWVARSPWECLRMGRLARKLNIDLVFTPSGSVIPGLEVPQVVLAQNPWALVANVAQRPSEKIKARLQRLAYRHTMTQARMMIFNSEFMRDAYRKNAGFEEAASAIVYQAIDDETHAAARKLRRSAARNPLQILTVSELAPHKNIETVVNAVQLVRRQHGLDARLVLVGGWPDQGYERRIRAMVSRSDLDRHVRFTGYVPRETLHRLYSESRVFCLMSRCESFGIPAVEAQAFGTPVVSSNCCAIPEVCGAGGIYPEPGDAVGVAARLARLLTNDPEWERMSHLAVQNARRYRWERCSEPLPDLLRQAAKERTTHRIAPNFSHA